MKTSSERRVRRNVRKLLGNSRLVTVLLDDGLLRLVLFLGIAVATSAAVLLAPVWITVPRGVQPAPRLSVWNLLAAKRLNYSAGLVAGGGVPEHSGSLLRQACERNPGSVEAHQNLAAHYLRLGMVSEELRGEARSRAVWLIRLDAKHEKSLVLAAQVLDLLRLRPVLLEETAQLPKPWPQVITRLRLSALLSLDLRTEFLREAAGLTSQERAQLPFKAYLAAAEVLGRSPNAASALEDLRKPTSDPSLAKETLKLWFWSALGIGDIDSARLALRKLVERQADETLDHVRLWRSMAQHNRTSEAADLLSERFPEPVLLSEAILTAEVMVVLRKDGRALQFLDQALSRWPQGFQLWALQWDILDRLEDPQALRASALKSRELAAENGNIQALSYLMEAKADLALRLPKESENALARSKDFKLDDPDAAIASARVLLALKRFSDVEPTLLPFKKDLDRVARYWLVLHDLAAATKSPPLFLQSAKALVGVDPNSLEFGLKLAAALVFNREEPTRALETTGGLKARGVDSAFLKILHAQALLLNKRRDEAEALLGSVPAGKLTAIEEANYRLARALAASDRRKGAEWVSRLSASDLFPEQIAWLESSGFSLNAR